MPAALVLTDESIDDVDAFAAALETVGLKAWDSTLRAARTFQGRIEGAGGWERVNLDTQLEWMRRARPFVAWQLVTGRLTATAEFLAFADLRIGLCARKHLPEVHEWFVSATRRLDATAQDTASQWNAVCKIAAMSGCRPDHVDTDAFVAARAQIAEAYKRRGRPEAGRNVRAVLHRLQLTLFHAGKIDSLARPASKPSVTVSGWDPIPQLYRDNAHRYIEQVRLGVAQQGLHHGQIHTGLGQSGAEGVAQGVGMRGRDAGDLAVIAEDPPQPRRGERLPASGALGHDEQPGAGRLGALGEQVGPDHPGDVHVEGDPALGAALARHPQPTSTDVDIGDIEGQHLRRAQPAEHHQPRDGAVPPRAQALQQRHDFSMLERLRKPLGVADPQRRAPPRRTRHVREHPAPLTRRRPPGLAARRHRVRRVRVAHRSEREQPRHRRQPQVDRGRRQRVGPAAVEPDHVRTAGPASHPLTAARGQEPQQHIRRDLAQIQVLVAEPAAERQQPEPIGADRARRVVPVNQIRQVVVHQPQPTGAVAGEPPATPSPLKEQPTIRHGHICNAQRTPRQAFPSANSQSGCQPQT